MKTWKDKFWEGVLLFTLVLMGVGAIMSCCTSRSNSAQPQVKIDTIFVHHTDTVKVTDVEREKMLVSQLQIAQDSLSFYRDSVTYENYINSRRIEKIKYYINITEKKTSNKKFFYGWIKRTMSEE